VASAPEPAVDTPASPAPAGRAEPEHAVSPEETALVSASTGASVSSAFNALATTMFLQNTGMVEEAVRDLVRPMLKQWLDDNLPSLVERLVRAEIERVARGGR
jgi:cell pole-organizing protein PopZ